MHWAKIWEGDAEILWTLWACDVFAKPEALVKHAFQVVIGLD